MELLLIGIWLYFSIFCHKMGHFMAAKIVGFNPHFVKIGSGQRILDFKFLESKIEFCLVPSGGITYTSNLSLENMKPKLIFMYLAGPMMNGLLFIFIMVFGKYGNQIFNEYNPAAFLGVYELFLFTGNLLPYESNIYGKSHPTDGKQVLDALTKTNEQFLQKKLGLARYTKNGDDNATEFFNNDLKTLHILYKAMAELQKRNFDQAMQLFEQILMNDHLIIRDQLYILDILVTFVIDHEQTQYLQKADKWSAQALSLASDIKTIQGTRGAILIELGRYSEGKEMLLPLTEEGNDLTDMAYSCCYIAKADHFLGNDHEIKHWLKKAAKTGTAQHILLKTQKQLNCFL
ncbi:site-2 protease family protein [Aliinostoc sp. HNIBRCY26]|uniref:tetratricopeptide repeat protein n=1 Tax=Aliinostoc sp. HNIBRCY26 TaxID=3418997 RepID=UPI003D040572